MLAPLLLMMAVSDFDEGQAAKFAQLALDCVHKEYPNKIAHALESDADVKPPHLLTPAFYGCYDWHSSVHGHWLLARLARLFPDSPFATDARKSLGKSLTAEAIRGEVEYLEGKGRASFERPYGLAWLLQFVAELREWKASEAQTWAANLKPLEAASVKRISDWLPKLGTPIRTGEHNNTAFGMGLMLDYARVVGNSFFSDLLASRARDFYGEDTGCPLNYEPSGEDFLSPCLAEADLMRRVLSRTDFAAWLSKFLPTIHLEPTYVVDFKDGKLYHLAGLNLSRSWMLDGLLSRLPESYPGRADMQKLSAGLRDAGLQALHAEHYEGGHWLGSFAVYLVSQRGLQATGGTASGTPPHP